MKPSEASKKLEFHSKQICHGCMHPSMVGWCENHCQLPEAFNMAISALEKQEQDRWVPVTERPPEEDGRYLITEKTDGTKVQEGYFCRTRDGEPYWGYLHVTAWRPLPEPYTEEEA